MADETSLAQALTNEHHEIDAGIEQFRQALLEGKTVAALAEPLRQAMTALRRHIYLEEEFAFPPIRQGGLTMPIMVMEREHGVLWGQMDDLEEELDTFDDASATEYERRALADACDEMLGVLESHNSTADHLSAPGRASQ